MARLTHNDRQNFLRAVFEDVPKSRVREEVRRMVFDDAVDKLPASLKELAKGPDKDYLAVTNLHIPSKVMYFHILVPNKRYQLSDNPALARKVEEMVRVDDEALAEVNRIKGSLTVALATITTDTALKERYPELAKYLPKALGGTKNVPATNDVMVGLKAAGFPKKV